jgi:PAS domain S-box-containing protein
MEYEPIKILLVEDNPGDASLVAEMLAETTSVQFELTESDRLETALALLEKGKFDIILLDLSLPDGYGINTVIQMHVAGPEIPIVVMSGLGDEDLAIKALHEGAQDYLVKGRVDSDLLIRSVRYAIERKQSEEALRKAYDELEQRVQERTEELVLVNDTLLAEIAEHKKTEKALQKSEASLAEAQRIARLGNWDWDIQTDELHWSEETYSIFGLIRKKIGTTYDEFLKAVHPEDREFVRKAGQDALRGNPYLIEHRIILPDGAIRFVSAQGEVAVGESGKPSRIFGIVQDVTEKKEKEMQLIMSERLAALGEMASGIAHEINNPLATIAACAEGLLNRIKKGQLPPELFENYLKIIDEEVLRCKGITMSMLSFVRKTAYEKENVDISSILDKTLELIGFQGRLKDVALTKQYNGQLIVRGSEGELKQVFLAVVSNALDAMEGKGSLTFVAGTTPAAPAGEETTVFIKISDTGPGIPSELTAKIFDPFFTMKTEKGGTGLGLSIARRIIKDHKGDILVTSERGKGATFTIILPGLPVGQYAR